MKILASSLALLTVFFAANALVFPAAARQDAAQAPAASAQKDGDAAAVSGNPDDTKQRRYAPSNFRLTINGANEGMVDSVEEKQATATREISGASGAALDPVQPAPPQVRIRQESPRSPGVVAAPNVGYTMFTPGAPTRATTNLQLSEAEKAAAKQETPDEDDEDEE